MSWPAPTRKDHEAFCETEGWELVRNARGRTSGAHAVTYQLPLHDGRTLRTRISHPVDASDYGASMWAHILRDQLDVDEQTFWTCAIDGIKPDRGQAEAPPEALPADLAYLLVTRLKLSSAEIAGMSREEAITRMQQHWSERGEP